MERDFDVRDSDSEGNLRGEILDLNTHEEIDLLLAIEERDQC